jgi:signal recognition particle subunit SRP19
MVFDADKAWVLWPEYFDSSRTRAEGRRVAKHLAIPEPQMSMIIKAVEKLGLEWKLEEGKAYPGAWWNKQGLLLVENNMPKTKLLPKVAEALRKMPRPQA